MLYLAALWYKGHFSIFCGDVIAITSRTPDVGSLVRPIFPEGCTKFTISGAHDVIAITSP